MVAKTNFLRKISSASKEVTPQDHSAGAKDEFHKHLPEAKNVWYMVYIYLQNWIV